MRLKELLDKNKETTIIDNNKDLAIVIKEDYFIFMGKVKDLKEMLKESDE